MRIWLKRIKLQVEGTLRSGHSGKGAVVMVSNLRLKDEAPGDFFTTIPIPLVNYGETVKLRRKAIAHGLGRRQEA